MMSVVVQPLAIFYRFGMSFGMGYFVQLFDRIRSGLLSTGFSAQSRIRLFGRIYCPDFLCLFCDWHLLYPEFKKAFYL